MRSSTSDPITETGVHCGAGPRRRRGFPLAGRRLSNAPHHRPGPRGGTAACLFTDPPLKYGPDLRRAPPSGQHGAITLTVVNLILDPGVDILKTKENHGPHPGLNRDTLAVQAYADVSQRF